MRRRSLLALLLPALGMRVAGQAAAGAVVSAETFEGKWRVKDYRQGDTVLAQAGTVVFTKDGKFEHKSIAGEKPAPGDMAHAGTFTVKGDMLRLSVLVCAHYDEWDALRTGVGYAAFTCTKDGDRIVLKGKCVIEKMP